MARPAEAKSRRAAVGGAYQFNPAPVKTQKGGIEVAADTMNFFGLVPFFVFLGGG
jgi:hypothetical protein